MPFCTNCGSSMEEVDRFCNNCGTEQGVRTSAPQSTVPKPKAVAPETLSAEVDDSPTDESAVETGEERAQEHVSVDQEPEPPHPAVEEPAVEKAPTPPPVAPPLVHPTPQAPEDQVAATFPHLASGIRPAAIGAVVAVALMWAIGIAVALFLRDAAGSDWAEIAPILPISRVAAIVASILLAVPLEASGSADLLGLALSANVAVEFGALLPFVIAALILAWSGRRASRHVEPTLLNALIQAVKVGVIFGALAAVTAIIASVESIPAVRLGPQPFTSFGWGLLWGTGFGFWGAASVVSKRALGDEGTSSALRAWMASFLGASRGILIGMLAASVVLLLSILPLWDDITADHFDPAYKPVLLAGLAAAAPQMVVLDMIVGFGPGVSIAFETSEGDSETIRAGLLNYPELDDDNGVVYSTAPWQAWTLVGIPAAMTLVAGWIAARRTRREQGAGRGGALALRVASFMTPIMGLLMLAARSKVSGTLSIDFESFSGSLTAGPSMPGSLIAVAAFSLVGSFLGTQLEGIDKRAIILTLVALTLIAGAAFGSFRLASEFEIPDGDTSLQSRHGPLVAQMNSIDNGFT